MARPVRLWIETATRTSGRVMAAMLTTGSWRGRSMSPLIVRNAPVSLAAVLALVRGGTVPVIATVSQPARSA